MAPKTPPWTPRRSGLMDFEPVSVDSARAALDELPEGMQDKEDSAYCQVRETFRALAGPTVADVDIELATIAAWCAAHGLAEMTSFRQFDPLKDGLGGEEGFLRAVLSHLGMFPAARAKTNGQG